MFLLHRIELSIRLKSILIIGLCWAEFPYAYRNIMRYFKANRMNLLIWGFLVVFVLSCKHFFSDGDFSFLLVLFRVLCKY